MTDAVGAFGVPPEADVAVVCSKARPMTFLLPSANALRQPIDGNGRPPVVVTRPSRWKPFPRDSVSR